MAGGGSVAKAAAKATAKAAESAGMKAPIAAAKDLTTLQDFHTSLGDRIRQRAADMQDLMESTPFKYDKGQRVFTESSAKKNQTPYTILDRTMVGNAVMREDHPEFGPGMGRVIKDPETGKAKRTPYVPGYRVRQEFGPDDWQEFSIPESAIKGDVEMASGGEVKLSGGGSKILSKTASRAAGTAARSTAKAIDYETAQQGPFYRVQARTPETAGQFYRGIREQIQEPTEVVGGATGVDVPQSISGDAVRQMMADPSNFVRSAADQYARQYAGGPYDLPQIPQSSLAKQSAIGRTFQLAAEDDPAYKKAVFDAYAKRYPKMIEQSGAKNYDQLVEASYRQLAKEAEQQFHSLPIRMSFHRQGEGNYLDSGEMLRDVYGNKHLYVFQGGEPHPFLNVIDPRTGLNSNEMFRAVHDFYGHAIHGNQFGPKGEEIAWAAHGKMFLR
jgi:hypothetical protein